MKYCLMLLLLPVVDGESLNAHRNCDSEHHILWKKSDEQRANAGQNGAH